MERRDRSGLRIRGVIVTLALIAALHAAAERSRAGAPERYRLADLQALEDVFVDLAADVRGSVVAIRCYEIRDPDDREPAHVKLPVSQGSGFIIGADGYIATNNHVIEGSDIITVVLQDGQRFEAGRVQFDIRSDLAVLKIDAHDLTPVRFGDLAEVRVNQWTFAYGNPFGLAFDNNGQASVTYGTVSALGRQMTQRLGTDPLIHYYDNLIETSSAINPGSSGGPLFDIDGRIIGVVTAIETSSGVNEGHGFAIPIDRNTRRILDTLKAGRAVHYGFLGVTVEDVRAPTSKRVAESSLPRGARISSISVNDGPAATAGLREGDVLIEYDGTPVEGRDHLVRLVQYTPVGTTVDVTYLRRQVRRKATVALGDRNELLGLSEPNR